MEIIKITYPNQPNYRASLLSVVLLAAFLIFSDEAGARNFKAEVSPAAVKPGDAFVVKVTGPDSDCGLSAVFRKKEILFSSCGDGCYIALAGVDLETKPGVYHVAVATGSWKRDLKLSVVKKNFPTVRLTLPEDKVTLSPEDLERTSRESEKLKAVFRKVSDRIWDGNFIMPVRNEISAVFGARRIINRKNTSIHKGVDIRGREGDEIMASNDGRVVLSEELFFGGNTVILDHGQGVYTIYMHLSKAEVDTGEIVLTGQVIGLVGSTGRSTGPHLHFGVRFGDMNVNPLSLISLAL